MLWNTNVWNFNVIHSFAQEIMGTCSSTSVFTFMISFIDGFNTVSPMRGLWLDLMELEPSIMGPWIVMGDFNAVRESHKKLGGRVLSDSVTRYFNECINRCGLQALGRDGSGLT